MNAADYPMITQEGDYVRVEVAHRCEMGDAHHGMEDCGQPCVSVLAADSGVWEAYVDGPDDPELSFLVTRDESVVDALLRWLKC